jgi:hypothetical protein
MREQMLSAVKLHAKGHIEKHRINIEIYLKNPTGIGEHSDIMESVEVELAEMSKYHDQLEMLKKYFS